LALRGSFFIFWLDNDLLGEGRLEGIKAASLLVLALISAEQAVAGKAKP
jgi:hypothetical protein